MISDDPTWVCVFTFRSTTLCPMTRPAGLRNGKRYNAHSIGVCLLLKTTLFATLLGRFSLCGDTELRTCPKETRDFPAKAAAKQRADGRPYGCSRCRHSRSGFHVQCRKWAVNGHRGYYFNDQGYCCKPCVG